MSKLHELLDKRKPIPGDVGIEIEYEGTKFKEVQTELWKTVDDGSLRGLYPTGRGEYVLTKPIPVNTVPFALNELKAAIPNAVPDFSFRTSVHVHVNVQDMEEDQVLNFIYTALLLEEPLANFCGNSRKGNRFCLRIQDAEFSLWYLNKVFANGVNEALRFNENHIRYAAINLASLKKYGSIEFRSMRGTLDQNVLSTWTTALVSIRNFACHHKNCLDIHDEFVRRGPREFLRYVLGDLAVQFEYKTLERDVFQSYSLTLELAHVYNNNIETQKRKVKQAKAKEGVEVGFDLEANMDFNPNVEMLFRRIPDVDPVPRAAPRVRRPAMIVDDLQEEVNDE